jgi:HAD superfamily hydrolase (TIGR01549 family)
MKRHLIFDFDETLVKSKETIYRAVKATGSELLKIKITDEDVSRAWGSPYAIFIDKVFRISESGFDIKEVTKAYRQNIKHIGIHFYNNASEILKELLEENDLSILSAGSSKIVREHLDELVFPETNFKHILGAEDTHFHKPDPRVFNVFFEMNNSLDRNQVYYIGDSKDDYEAAFGAGLKFIGIDHNKLGTFDKLNTEKVNNFLELKQKLLNETF